MRRKKPGPKALNSRTPGPVSGYAYVASRLDAKAPEIRVITMYRTYAWKPFLLNTSNIVPGDGNPFGTFRDVRYVGQRQIDGVTCDAWRIVGARRFVFQVAH